MAGSGDKPEDREEPLTSTGMFLRSFGAAPADSKAVEDEAAGPEFRFSEEAAASPAPAPASDPPAQTAGEFTRLFVRPTPSGEHERLTTYPGPAPADSGQFSAIRSRGPSALESLNSRQTTDGPPLPAAAPPAASGSSPSQYFSREIARPFPSPVKRAEPAPTGDSSRVGKASGHGSDANSSTPAGATTAAPSSEVADLLRDLYSDHSGQAGREPVDRQRGFNQFEEPSQNPFRDAYREPYREPAPSFAHQPPPSVPSPVPANNLTVMLDQLTLDEARAGLRTPSLERPTFQPQPAPLPPSAPAGPGEYTRVINRLELGESGESRQSGQSGSPVPAAAAPPSSVPAPVPAFAPAFQMPAVSGPAIVPPVATAPSATAPGLTAPAVTAPGLTAPRFEAPRVTAPAPIAPAPIVPVVAAPKSKLQEMLPLLLIANAFLMIVLIVVVVFALRAKT